MELKDQLTALQAELKTHFEKAEKEQKENGTILSDTKSRIDAIQKQVDAIDVKLAERHAAAEPEEPLLNFLQKHEGLQRLMRDKAGSTVIHLDSKQAAKLERKTNITESAVGYATSGVLLPDRIPGITPEARQRLTVRDALVTRPTTMAFIDFVKVNAKPANASPQTEASDKGENAVTFTTGSEKVRTLATWIPASKQVLDDMTELMGYLQTALPYYVNLLEETQFLSGDGNDPNVHGLIPQATSFSSSLLTASAGWTFIDVVDAAIQQIQEAKEIEPTFLVLNPRDWHKIRRTKDSYGRYILGDPAQQAQLVGTGGILQGQPNIWGLLPIATTSIASGTFLVGSGDPVATEIRDRMDMTVEIATQHSDFFAKNLIAIRAEKRVALVTKRPASFITGSFTTSP